MPVSRSSALAIRFLPGFFRTAFRARRACRLSSIPGYSPSVRQRVRVPSSSAAQIADRGWRGRVEFCDADKLTAFEEKGERYAITATRGRRDDAEILARQICDRRGRRDDIHERGGEKEPGGRGPGRG